MTTGDQRSAEKATDLVQLLLEAVKQHPEAVSQWVQSLSLSIYLSVSLSICLSLSLLCFSSSLSPSVSVSLSLWCSCCKPWSSTLKLCHSKCSLSLSPLFLPFSLSLSICLSVSVSLVQLLEAVKQHPEAVLQWVQSLSLLCFSPLSLSPSVSLSLSLHLSLWCSCWRPWGSTQKLCYSEFNHLPLQPISQEVWWSASLNIWDMACRLPLHHPPSINAFPPCKVKFCPRSGKLVHPTTVPSKPLQFLPYLQTVK